MTSEETSLPFVLEKPRLQYKIVDSDQAAVELISKLEAADTLAIDAERASGFRYGQKAYLIQIAIKDQGIFLIDTVSSFSEDVIKRLSSSINSKLWIIHAASQDLSCLREFGLKPERLVDTELAGRLLGLPKVSLGSMTETFLNLGLAKEHSAVDWSTRPLPDEWLNYAALDVDVLFDLWENVERQLSADGKKDFAEQEFSYLVTQPEKPEKTDRWRSITGIHELKDAKQLTTIKHLWIAREGLAKEKDVAPGRLVPDRSLVDLVKAAPQSKSELNSLRSFTGRASRTFLDVWWAAYDKGRTDKNLVDLKQKSTGIPNHRNWANKFPEAHARLLWAKKSLADLSQAERIPVENLIAPDVVRILCFNPPQSDLITQTMEQNHVRPWQIKLTLSAIQESLTKSTPPEEETKVSAPAVNPSPAEA